MISHDYTTSFETHEVLIPKIEYVLTKLMIKNPYLFSIFMQPLSEKGKSMSNKENFKIQFSLY